MDSSYSFSLDPALLDLRIKEFEARSELLRSVAARAAITLGKHARMLELDYAELLCAQQVLGPANALPNYLTSALGLGVCTYESEELTASDYDELRRRLRREHHQTRRQLLKTYRGNHHRQHPARHHSSTYYTATARNISAVKTSPKTPAEELENLNEIRSWARNHDVSWFSKLFKPETAALNCQATKLARIVTKGGDQRPGVGQTATTSLTIKGLPSLHDVPDIGSVARMRHSLDGKVGHPEESLESLADKGRLEQYRAEFNRLHTQYLAAIEKVRKNTHV